MEPQNQNKMGFLDVLGGFGLGASALNTFKSWFSNDYEETAARNREWQSEENQKNRDWQSSEWSRQFDLTNEYNDPSNQVARLAKAGINPAVAFQGANAGVGQSSASPSAPSGASSSVTTPFPDSVLTQGFQSADAFNRAIESYSKLRANEADVPLKKAYEHFLKNQASHEAVKQELDEFDYQMKLVYGEALENQRVNQALANYKHTLADTLLKAAQTGEANEHSLELAALRLLHESSAQLNDTSRQLLETDLKYAAKRIQSMIRYYDSTAEKNYAEAESVRFWNTLYSDERNYLVKNIHNDAAQKFQNVRMTQNQRDLLHYHIQQAKYANDQKEIKFWNDLIMQDLGVASDMVQDFTRLSSFKALSKSQQDKVKLDEEKFRYETETFEDTYNRYDLQGRKHTYKGRRKLDGTNWKRSTND